MEKYTGLIVAKLAKEKGFDEKCREWFNTDGICENIFDMFGWNYNKGNPSRYLCSRPTQSHLHNWLIETFKINVNVKHIPHNQKYGYTITGSYHEGVNGVLKSYDFKSFETHQEAFEDGLEEALKLIKL